MLEMLLDPRRAERRPWELFFIGAFYAGISVILANWIFLGNPIFSGHISILTITFTVMFSIPFFYFVIRLEERKSYSNNKRTFLGEHGRAISALLWLFVGFVFAYSIAYIVSPGTAGETFSAQIAQYCNINMPSNIQGCIANYGDVITGKVSLYNSLTAQKYALNIFTNNFFVMIFSVLFSIIFGAGAIFILAWNASVIAAAIGIFTQSSLKTLPVALSRYLIHGIPEIGSYFVAALAGGILGVALIKHDLKEQKFWNAVRDSLNLILIAIGLLVIGTIIEVWITPRLF